jgi:hypothetical protein
VLLQQRSLLRRSRLGLESFVGSDRVLSPGESFDVEFDILFLEKKPFTFFVDLLGVPGP